MTVSAVLEITARLNSQTSVEVIFFYFFISRGEDIKSKIDHKSNKI